MQVDEQEVAKAAQERCLEPEEGARPSVVVRETEAKGQGVFATGSISEGEVAIVGTPVSVTTQRTWKTLQVDRETHVRMDLPFELVNHSCDPNCGIKPNGHGGYDLVAMRPIATGEEITFDYCMTEWECIGFRDCHCGSGNCRKVIRGAAFLPAEKLEKYEGFTAPYYRHMPEPAGRLG